MNKVSGILSSKGQITLPKTVRDVMSLSTGDEIDFFIEEDGEVTMKKGNEKSSAAYNLVELLLESGIVVLTGKAGEGKTYFAINLIKKFFGNKATLIMDPHNEYKVIISDVDMVTILNPENEYNIDGLLKMDLDFIVAEEPQSHIDFQTILALRETGLKVVVIMQECNEKETSLLGSHYSVAIKRSSPTNVEEIAKITFDGTIKKTTLFNM
jgi:AbrB family looped-hinge helix DNA binding protein